MARFCLPATVGLLILGCGELTLPQQYSEPTPQRTPEAIEDEPGTLVIEGKCGGRLRYATEESFRLGADIEGARKDIVASRRTVLRFDKAARPEFLAEFVRTFVDTHGFWQEITLAERDPDAEYEGCEATISLDKSSYAAHEPILLTINVSREVGVDILVPEHVRIVDSFGEEVNILTKSLGGGQLYMAPVTKLPTKTFDLTSFSAIFSHEDYVWRFAPGRYFATFHFSVGWPEWHEPFNGIKELGPRHWGRKTSNTVSFEITETRPLPERIRAMLDTAARLAEKARALPVATQSFKKDKWTRDTINLLKRVIVSSSDLATTLEAVRRIEAARADKRFDPDTPPSSDALVLALANASEQDRRAACERYVRVCRKATREELNGAERKMLRDYPFKAFFGHPQFHAILDEQLHREVVEYPYADVFFSSPCAKEAEIMAHLLPQYPAQVLDHYSWYKAPPKIAKLLPGYFRSKKEVYQSGGMRWLCADASLQAFELAAGLDLGYRERADRIRDREIIAGVLGRWCRRDPKAFDQSKTQEP